MYKWKSLTILFKVACVATVANSGNLSAEPIDFEFLDYADHSSVITFDEVHQNQLVIDRWQVGRHFDSTITYGEAQYSLDRISARNETFEDDIPSLNPFIPQINIDFSTLTDLIDERRTSENPIPCIEEHFRQDDTICSDFELAGQALQLNKSVQALAKALGLAGIGLSTRVQEDIIREDIRRHGLDVGLITPAIYLARIYASEQDTFGSDGRQIYELSNLALGYIYAPDMRLDNPFSGMGDEFISEFVIDEDTCEIGQTRISESISLLEYTDPALSTEISQYAILDQFDNEVIFYPEPHSITGIGLDFGRQGQIYKMRGSTSPYDLSEFDIPDYFAFSFVSRLASNLVRHESIFVEDISGGMTWQNNSFDAVQASIVSPVPFEFYASGANSSNMCVSTCFNNRNFVLARQFAAAGLGSSVKDFIGAFSSGNVPAIIVTSTMVISDGIDLGVLRRDQNFQCSIECNNLDFLREDIRFFEHQAAPTLSAQKIALERELAELHRREAELTLLLGDSEEQPGLAHQKLDELEQTFGDLKTKLDQDISEGRIDTRDELIRREMELDEADQRVQEQNNEIDQLEREHEQVENEIPKKEAEIDSKQQEIDSQRQEIEETREQIQQIEDELRENEEEAQLQLSEMMECDDPAFVIPNDMICIFDQENNRWRLVIDQGSLDRRAFLATCAIITVPPGSTCTVIDGRPVIVGTYLDVSNNVTFPSINHCHYMRLTPGSECTMVGSTPVITNDFPPIRPVTIPDLSTSFCAYAKVPVGTVCIDTPNGPLLGNDSGDLMSLVRRTDRRWCQYGLH